MYLSQLWSDWQSLLAIFRGAPDWRFWQAWFVSLRSPPPLRFVDIQIDTLSRIALVIGVLYVLSPFDLLPDYGTILSLSTSCSASKLICLVAHGVVLLDDLLIMLWLAYFLRSLARENRHERQ